MAVIVVMEDDADLRTLIVQLLTHEGYEVLAADNGSQGLELVGHHRPDLIISDVQMPGMTGFQVLDSVRQSPALSATPVILLTGLQDRVHVRQGMTAGADDYITKPFEPSELTLAVDAQLTRRAGHSARQQVAVTTAVNTAVNVVLDDLYEQRLEQQLGTGWPAAQSSASDESFANATVLFVDMANYRALSEQLSGAELSELLKTFYGSAGDTVHLFGARHMQLVGEGLLAVFVESNDTQSVNHGLRASRAALGLIDSAQRMRHYVQTRFADRQLPEFKVAVALHSGPVVLARMDDPLNGAPTQTLPVGDVVSATMLLQKQAQALDWPIVASQAMLASVQDMVKTGRQAAVSLPGRALPVEAAELLKAGV
jgi:DNA-binding response OmpR family regulator